MGIKYICDFCDAEATGYHEELKNGKIICKNCMEHLQNQTWRLAEETTFYSKAKEKLEKETKQLSREKEEIMKKKEVDRRLVKHYHDAFHAVLRLYNEIVYILDKAIPKSFLFHVRKDFNIISEEAVENLEKMTIEEILDAVEKNFRGNFDSYLGDYCFSSTLLNNLPTMPLKDSVNETNR